MSKVGTFGVHSDLTESLGFENASAEFWNLAPDELVRATLERGQGKLATNGALAIDTGKFTGRSPKDRFIVKDAQTEDAVWWGAVNIPFDSDAFDRLYDKMCTYAECKELFIRDGYACASPTYQLNLRVVAEYPWSNLFAYNMFMRPSAEELNTFTPEWHVICLPGFLADPEVDGTRQANFAILNFTRKMILIGGTGYT